MKFIKTLKFRFNFFLLLFSISVLLLVVLLVWLTASNSMIPAYRERVLFQKSYQYIAGKLLHSNQMTTLLQCHAECLANEACFYLVIDKAKVLCYYYDVGTTNYNVQNLQVYIALWTTESVSLLYHFILFYFILFYFILFYSFTVIITGCT